MTGASGPARTGDDPGFRSASSANRLGHTLGGKWTLERLLGEGGSACVYAARHRNGRRAALKVLHDDLARQPRIVRRFLAEGRAANKIGHPGVLTILDDGQDADGTMFLVMELLHGEALAEQLQRLGPLPPEDAAAVGVGVLDVLAAAHDVGIVHRDIKPSNVFKTDAGEIKVLDFGAARLREAEDFATRSGSTLGTPAFMAPELAAGRIEDVDARSDIWAVGATLFQLLTGTTVHAARTSNEAIVNAATRPVPPIASIRPDVPLPLAAIVDRALAFEKADRWPNARAMQAALLTAHPEAGVHRTDALHEAASIPETYVAPRLRRSRRGLTVGAAAIAALVIAATWTALGRAPGAERVTSPASSWTVLRRAPGAERVTSPASPSLPLPPVERVPSAAPAVAADRVDGPPHDAAAPPPLKSRRRRPRSETSTESPPKPSGAPPPSLDHLLDLRK